MIISRTCIHHKTAVDYILKMQNLSLLLAVYSYERGNFNLENVKLYNKTNPP